MERLHTPGAESPLRYLPAFLWWLNHKLPVRTEYAKLDDLMQRYMSQVISGEMDAQAAKDATIEEITEILLEAGLIEE